MQSIIYFFFHFRKIEVVYYINGKKATHLLQILFLFSSVSFSFLFTPLHQTFTDFVFLVCVNFFGVYFRLLNEVAIRRAFLDRRECVEGNLLLRLARDQEVL